MRPTVLALAASLGVAACSAAPPSSGSSWTGTLSLTIAPGVETTQCKLVALPDADSFAVGFAHDLSAGSHHVVVYRTDLTSIPVGGEVAHDCYDTPVADMMHVTGVLYGSQVPHGEVALPKGVGLPLSRGEVVLLQAHYLNATAAPLDALATVTLDTVGEGITQRAGIMAFYDGMIRVPAGATAQASMSCAIPDDITLLAVFAHEHARGVGFRAWVDGPDGALSSAPFYTSADWVHPQPLSSPVSVHAGSRLRFACDYDNHAGARDYYQGLSAQDDEMCAFGGLYFPAMPETADYCIDKDRLGTGDQTCKQALACRRQCPNDPALDHDGLSPCLQTCYATSCPSATKPLLAVGSCTQSRCATECAHRPSTDCDACIDSQCAAQVDACNAAPCGP